MDDLTFVCAIAALLGADRRAGLVIFLVELVGHTLSLLPNAASNVEGRLLDRACVLGGRALTAMISLVRQQLRLRHVVMNLHLNVVV